MHLRPLSVIHPFPRREPSPLPTNRSRRDRGPSPFWVRLLPWRFHQGEQICLLQLQDATHVSPLFPAAQTISSSDLSIGAWRVMQTIDLKHDAPSICIQEMILSRYGVKGVCIACSVLSTIESTRKTYRIGSAEYRSAVSERRSGFLSRYRN